MDTNTNTSAAPQAEAVETAATETAKTIDTAAISKVIASNPAGTTYDHLGKATAPAGSKKPAADLPEIASEYNSDGSIFVVPAEATTTIASTKHDIASKNAAIGQAQVLVDSATTMRDSMGEDMKPAFQAAIDAQSTFINALKKDKEELLAKLEAVRLSTVPPSVRGLEAELSSLIAQRTELTNRIDVLLAKKKALSGNIETAAANKTSSQANKPSTDAQKANLEAAIAEYGSQGKAIVAMVKQGKTNTEIYHHFGIPSASVPGPKGAFLKSPEGEAWKLANPVLAAQV